VTGIDAAMAAVEAAKAEADRNQRVEALLTEINDKLARLLEVTPPRLLTVNEGVARGLGSPATLRRRIKDGSLKSVRIGRKVLIDASAIRGPDKAEVARLASEARTGR
jgi:hypothetical protein